MGVLTTYAVSLVLLPLLVQNNGSLLVMQILASSTAVTSVCWIVESGQIYDARSARKALLDKKSFDEGYECDCNEYGINSTNRQGVTRESSVAYKQTN